MAAVFETSVEQQNHRSIAPGNNHLAGGDNLSTPIYLYVPATFDPALFPELKGCEEEAYWFLHKVVSLQIFYRHTNRKHVNISQQTIRQFIHPRIANTVRFTLLKAFVIECDGEYRVGTKSLGYRIAKPYRGDIKRVEIFKLALKPKSFGTVSDAKTNPSQKSNWMPSINIC